MIGIDFNSKATIKKLEELHPGGEYRKWARQLNNEKRKAFMLAIMAGIICAFLYSILLDKGGNIEKLKRNAPGGGSRDVTLEINYEGTDIKDRRLISVNEQRYSDEELKEYSEGIEEIIWDRIKGENSSLEDIIENLDMPSSIEGYPFDISYKSDKPLLLSAGGVINKEKLRQEIEKNESYRTEGIPVRICVSLSYDDYREDIYEYVLLKEDKSKNLNTFREEVSEQIKLKDEESRSFDYQLLPKSVNGIGISYEIARSHNSLLIALMGIVCAIGLVIGKDKELDKQIKERNEELERDYPKILNQYALYYSAGMSHRRIWQEICNRYEKELEEGGKKKYAYEEMLRTNRRLSEGMGEIESYEEFASRCHMVKYRAFINLIEQSVKKGKDKLDIVLDEEVEKAGRQENNRIRMISQELSTKLLLPMMLMLIIVLVIVMVPAFISFNG